MSDNKPLEDGVYVVSADVQQASRLQDEIGITADKFIDMGVSMSKEEIGKLLTQAIENNDHVSLVVKDGVTSLKRTERKVPKPRPVRIIPDSRLGRNEPCYCGSGNKYKKCCMRKPTLNLET